MNEELWYEWGNLDEAEKQRAAERNEAGENEDAYTIKDLEKEIKKLNKEVEVQKEKMLKHEEKAKNRSLLSEPRKREGECWNILNNLDEAYQWRNYKYHLYSEWQDTRKGLLARNPEKDIIPSTLLNMALIAMILYEIVSRGISNFSLIAIVRVLILAFIIQQVVMLMVSTYTYVIKPNQRIKDYHIREYKELKKSIQEIESQIKLKSELLEAAKVSAIRPKEVMMDIKEGTNANMKAEVSRVRETLLPKMYEKYRKNFSKILDKCDKLLSLCGTDGAALNEVSNIYNILIRETAMVVLKYDESNALEISSLLDNFESYLDRKINKYKVIKDISLNSDVNALNNIFKSDY